MIKQCLKLLSAALLLGSAIHVHAAGYKLGDISVTDPHARPTVVKQPSGAAYVTVENRGKAADRLLGVSSPVAESAAIHTMAMDGDIMRMREAGPLPLAPAAKVEMKPGAGYHIMLIGLKRPLQPGDSFPVTLSFEKAGKLEVLVTVDGRETKPEGHGH